MYIHACTMLNIRIAHVLILVDDVTINKKINVRFEPYRSELADSIEYNYKCWACMYIYILLEVAMCLLDFSLHEALKQKKRVFNAIVVAGLHMYVLNGF